MDGKPLRTGLMAFHREGGGPVATAQIKEDGGFEARTGGQSGLPPGKYIVTVTAVEGSVPLPTREQPNPQVNHLVSPRFSSPKTSNLCYEIERGSNVLEIQVSKH